MYIRYEYLLFIYHFLELMPLFVADSLTPREEAGGGGIINKMKVSKPATYASSILFLLPISVVGFDKEK